MSTGRPSVDVQDFLKDLHYPASKRELVETAEQNHAPEDVINSLEGLPDREYRRPEDIVDEFGKRGIS